MATQKDFRIKNGLQVRGGNIVTSEGSLNLVDQISGDTGQIIINNGQFGNSFMRMGMIGGGDANSFIRTDRTLEFHIGQSATSSTPSAFIDTSHNLNIKGNFQIDGVNRIVGTSSYTEFRNPQGVTKLWLGGGSDGTSDPSVYVNGNNFWIRDFNSTVNSVFSSSGLDIKRGDLKLNATTVIDSSRNLQNIGTISNSAFTIPNSIGTAGQVLKVPSSGTTLEWGNSSSVVTGITNFADNRLLTASGSTTINGESNLTFNGSALNVVGDITLGDNKNIYIGTSNELQLVHNGNDSLIRHTISTGELKLGSSGTGITFYNPSNGDIYAEFNAGADVTLYHNDQPKIATTSSGIDVTGTVTADGLTVDGATTLNNTSAIALTLQRSSGASSNVSIKYDGASQDFYTGIASASEDFVIGASSNLNGDNFLRVANNGDISFYEDTGTSAALFWDASAESLGIGLTNPSEKLEVSGKIKASGQIRAGSYLESFPSFSFANDTDTGMFSDTANQLEFSTGGSSRLVINSSGNVGISETSPQNPLHVRSDSASGENYAIQIDNNNTTVGSQIGMLFRSRVGTTNTDFSIRGIANGADDMDLTFNSDGGSERLRITKDGSVAIGNASPQQRLTVGDGSGSELISIYAGTTGASGIHFTDTNTSGDDFQGFVTYGHDVDALRFGTAETEHMRLDSQGRLGLGTYNPVQDLELNKNAANVNLNIRSSDTGNATLLLGDQSDLSVASITLDNSSNDLIFKNNNQQEAMRIDSSLNVGIGVTNPSSYWGQADNLVVGGTGNDGITIKSSATGNGRLVFTDTASSTAGLNDGGQIQYNHVSDYMTLRTNGAEQVRIDSSGNTTFNSAVEVIGNIDGTTADFGGAVSIDSLKQGLTTVIDSSRNLTNIGTISSSYFNSSSNINATGVAGFTVGGGRIGFDQSGTRSWTMGASSGYLSIFSGDGNGDLNLANSIGLRQNGTLVLDSSRNLSNIGTITSGAIGVDGDITLTEGDKIKTSESSGGSHLLLRSDNLGVTSNSLSLIGLNDILIGSKSNQSGTGNIYFGYNAENKASGSGWVDTLTITDSGNFEFNNGNFTEVGTISSRAITATANSNAILMQTSSNPSSYYAYISANYSYAQAFSIKAKGAGSEYTLMDWGDGVGLEFHGGSTQNIKFSNHNLSSIGTISSLVNANRFLKYRSGSIADFEVSSDNNSNAVMTVTGTGTADIFKVRDNTNDVFTIADGGNSTFAGNLFAKNVVFVGGNSYNENIRMHPSSNDYSSLVLGAVSGNSGTGTGQWTLVRYPTATYSNKFTIRHNSTDFLTINTSGNTTFAGTISSGAITSSGDITLSGANDDLIFTDKSSVIQFGSSGTNTAWSAPKIWRSSSNYIAISDYSGVELGGYNGTAYGARLRVEGNGDVNIIEGGLEIAGTTVIDSSRNFTNLNSITLNGSLGTWSVDNQGAIMNFSRNTANYIRAGSSSGYLVFQTGGSNTALTLDGSQNATFSGTISSGAITLADGSHLQAYTSNGTTGTGGVDLPRGGHITFYGNNNVDHSIGSRNHVGNVTDDLRISSYGALYIDLDSNDNNSSSADFVIGRHGSGTGTMSTLVTISGEDGSYTSSGTITSGNINIDASGTSERYLQIGTNTTANHYAYIDLVGDTTYSDYGLRIIRNNGGANTSSFIYHRGTGNFNIETQDSASILLRTAGQTALTIDSSQNATFAGQIHLTGSSSIRSNSPIAFNAITGAAQSGLFKSVAAQTSYANSASDGMFNALNGYAVGTGVGTTVIDSSRNLTNIGTISSGAITTSGNVSVGGSAYTTNADLNLLGDGLAIKNDKNGSNNNWSYIQNTSSGSEANLVFTTGLGSALTLNHDRSATFSGKVIMGGDGAIAQIANAVAADTSNTYTLAVGSQSSSKSIIAARNINTSGGGYQINGTTVIDSSRDVTANSVLLSGLQTQVLSVSGGELLMGAVDNDDFVTNIKGFGGSTSMEFADGAINAVGSTTINHSKSSTANPVLALKNTSTTNEGRYLQFTDNAGSFVGQIGKVDQTESNIFISTFDTGLKFESYITYKAILPCGTDGADVDNIIDLGSSSVRFDDIYATNGTIQTSDRNLKQDIQALTDAEQRVATACKGLIRRFRWQDSVAEKDNNPDSDETARYHFGVIAQDLQDAFEAEGLDASDYGMFISSTWTDDDGVEQTRLGVRYNELLSFIITTL